MAEMSIQEAIDFIRDLPKRIGEKGAEAMKEEFGAGRPYSEGNRTYNSIDYEVNGSSVFIGTDTEGAYYVQNGRRDVYPVRAKALHWKGRSGEDVFSQHSGAVKPDDFVGRTAKRISAMDFH